MLRLIKEYISDTYNTTDPRFAAGICEKCHRKLGKLAKKPEDTESTILVSSQFCVTLPVQTRSFIACTCVMCSRAKCFSKIYRGSNHTKEVCRSKETLSDNLANVNPKILKKALQTKALYSKRMMAITFELL